MVGFPSGPQASKDTVSSRGIFPQALILILFGEHIFPSWHWGIPNCRIYLFFNFLGDVLGIFWWSAGGWSRATNRCILCLDFLLPWTWPCPKNMLFVIVVRLLSHTQLCDPMDCSMPDSPVLYNLLEFAQTSLSLWCHPTISSSVAPFSSCPQSFPALGSFPLSWLFASGGQSIGASASVTVLPMNIQDWFPLGLIGWISLQSSSLSRVFSSSTSRKHQFFSAHLSLLSNYHIWYMTTRITIALTIQTLSAKWCLCFLIGCLGLS